MIHVMYWNYHYFKYFVILFILLGFHLSMLNKYRFRLKLRAFCLSFFLWLSRAGLY